jgi:hypothetical protein
MTNGNEETSPIQKNQDNVNLFLVPEDVVNQGRRG